MRFRKRCTHVRGSRPEHMQLCGDHCMHSQRTFVPILSIKNLMGNMLSPTGSTLWVWVAIFEIVNRVSNIIDFICNRLYDSVHSISVIQVIHSVSLNFDSYTIYATVRLNYLLYIFQFQCVSFGVNFEPDKRIGWFFSWFFHSTSWAVNWYENMRELKPWIEYAQAWNS